MRNKVLAETLAAGLTLARLASAEHMARRVKRHECIGAAMAAFVALDVFDGWFARRLGVDTPRRRVLDAFVDRAAIARVAFATAQEVPKSRSYLTGLLIEEATMTVANARHHLSTGEVVQGVGPLHKAGSLSVAVLGVAANTQNDVALHAAGATANVINLARAAEYVSNAIQPHGTVQGGIRKLSSSDL